MKLLTRLADTNEKNRALFAAVEGGPVGVVVTDLPQSPAAPLQAVDITESWTATAEVLLDSGADIEARNENGSTPLMWAAQFAQTDVVRILIRRGLGLMSGIRPATQR